MPMTGRNPDSPGVIAHPLLIFGGTLALGLLLHFLFPNHPFPSLPARLLGGILLIGGVALGKWGETVMRSAGTNVNPRDPTTSIVVEGPFRFSRNPLYLSVLLDYLGVALLVNALWPLILLPPLCVVIQWGVIKREERYLEAKFGEPYRAYTLRVRRWI